MKRKLTEEDIGKRAYLCFPIGYFDEKDTHLTTYGVLKGLANKVGILTRVYDTSRRADAENHGVISYADGSVLRSCGVEHLYIELVKKES